MTEDADIIEKFLKGMEDASYADMIAETESIGLTVPKIASDAWKAGYSTAICDIFKLRAHMDAHRAHTEDSDDTE